MNDAGFSFTRLTLKGEGVSDASITFQSGLNVVVGPSDTGKTFIVQCIDFMLGASHPPKEIPEAKDYQFLQLALCPSNNSDCQYILERSLRGGDLRLMCPGEPTRVIAGKHQPDNNETLSHFLLSLSGLTGKNIRTNKAGKTRQLSFRDIARLILIDEESIISERSPIFTGQRTSATAESNVFRLLLTGSDDSSIISKESPKIIKVRQQGKVEILDQLVEGAYEKLHLFGLPGEISILKAELNRLDSLLKIVSDDLSTEQRTVASVEEQRKNAWTQLRQIESRIEVLIELQKRFNLLREQYTSDLKRLNSISEVSVRLGQLNESRCPVCGAEAQHHAYDHEKVYSSPAEVAQACDAESHKIRSLIVDLDATLQNNIEELERLKGEKVSNQEHLRIANDDIQNLLQPRLQTLLEKYSKCQAQREVYRRAFELHEQIEEWSSLKAKATLRRSSLSTDSPIAAIESLEIDKFCRVVESILKTWNFPYLDRVSFSEADNDLIISGLRRASHGKGVRSIFHAAFNLAILKYCREINFPHPGLVIIDSPLVVYREPDKDEGDFSRDLKNAFYYSLATDYLNNQIIIMENDDPPADLDSTVNVIKFTGADYGRQGFIPIKNGVGNK
jgi:hypothetical protein